jgi:hypothetical protein
VQRFVSLREVRKGIGMMLIDKRRRRRRDLRGRLETTAEEVQAVLVIRSAQRSNAKMMYTDMRSRSDLQISAHDALGLGPRVRWRWIDISIDSLRGTIA